MAHKASRDGAGVRERSHNRLKTMTTYDKALTVFAGAALVIAGATAAYAGPRCPDQQMSEGGPFQGQICKYGDWQVSDAGPYSYRY